MATERRQPTDRDLAVWRGARGDLLERLYQGVTGRLQIAGHRVIAKWSRRWADNVIVEVGCGYGHHLRYADHDGLRYSRYIGVDLEHAFLRTLRNRFPSVRVINSDAYVLPFQNSVVDCVLSVYCCEHLRRLAECLGEIQRVMKPHAELLVGLPAEGGILYGIGRRLTSKPYMEQRYGIDYEAVVKWEHWNTYREVAEILEERFAIVERRFLPFRWLRSVHMNAIVCLRCRSKYRGGRPLNSSEVRPRPSSDDQNSRTRDPAASSDDDGKGPA